MGTQAKDFSSAYLKIAVHLINEKPEEMDLKLGRPLKVEDLDHLSSENMLKIVVFLLMDVIGDKPISKITSLTDFNRFGIGDVSYDCAVDQIYHAVKQIFPEDDEIFHYSVLMFPAKDPKRTKHVISYIMSFFLMCDEFHDSFSACFNEVLNENEEKVAICNEIDDLKESITDVIQKREAEKRRLPELQKEMRSIEENIREQQGVLSNLNAKLDKHKTSYETKEDQIRQLEKHLQQMDVKIRNLTNEIVPNPSEMRAENIRIKKELEERCKQRESIGLELERLRKECDVFESLIHRAKDAIQNFESVIMAMKNTKTKIECFSKSGNELTVLARKIEHLKGEAEQLAQRHKEKLKEADARTKLHESKMNQVQEEVSKLKRQIADTKEQMKTMIYEMAELAESFNRMEEEIKNLQIQFSQYVHEVLVLLPEQKEAIMEKLKQYLVEMLKKYSRTPFIIPKN